jgi:hypothetical protein
LNVLQELIPFRKEVEALSEKEIGKTLVFLDGNRLSCRMVECNLGNFMADSYVDLVNTPTYIPYKMLCRINDEYDFNAVH